MTFVIETARLTKHFGALVALDRLDLSIERGEIFGFLGPNGAGKSTAIKLLLDEIRPTSGSATLFGLDSHLDVIEVHRRVGYLPGELRVPGNLTGEQYLDFLGGLRHFSETAYRDELIDRFDFDPTRRLGELSTGNKQKVGLIQAFMHRPELILLDEPTTGLDPLVQHDIHALLRDVATEGATVLLSSHMLSEVDRVADRIGVLRNGALVTVDWIDALKARERRRLELDFSEAAPGSVLEAASGVRSVTTAGTTATVTVEGEVDAVIRAAIGAGHVVSIRTPEADLEDIFLDFYRDDEPEVSA